MDISHLDNKQTISVVIPVFGSESSLGALHGRLSEVMGKLGRVFEIVFVDDCGPSQSLEILRKLAEDFDNVVVVEMLRNVGQMSATVHGMSVATGDLIVTMDDDLQHSPEHIPLMLRELEERDLDLVVACFPDKKHSALRNFGSNFARRVAIRGLPVDRDTRFSSFRIMRKEVFQHYFGQGRVLNARPNWMYFTAPRHAQIEVSHSERFDGDSSYSLWDLFRMARPLFNGLVEQSLKILVALSVFQIVVAVVGSGFVWLRYSQGQIEEPGFTSVILILLGIVGFLGITVGLFAQYLQSIKRLILAKPDSLIRTVRRSGNS